MSMTALLSMEEGADIGKSLDDQLSCSFVILIPLAIIAFFAAAVRFFLSLFH